MVLDANTPKSYAYLVSHLSKALIKQAESEVSAKAEAAFPLARVVLGLILRGHAALSEILFARFVKKCPWVVPFYPSKQPVSPKVYAEADDRLNHVRSTKNPQVEVLTSRFRTTLLGWVGSLHCILRSYKHP